MAQNITLLGASYSDVPAVILPKTGGGVAQFIDVTETTALTEDVASGKIFFGADGAQLIGTATIGGLSGFEIEEGTYTPVADEGAPVIPFARTHDTMPFFVAISDASRTSTSGSIGATTNTFYDLIYFNWKNLFDASQPRYVSASTTKRYGIVYRVYGTSSEVSPNANTDLTVLDTSTGTSSGAYPRYWVTPSEFKPRAQEGSVTIKFKKGKAYKWIAVWKT